MNKGKVEAAFEYSHTYIQFLAFLKIGFKIAYRTVQGIIRALSDYISRIEEIHFTQIRRRILKVKPSVGNLNLDNDNDDDNKPITLIVDASGLTITKKGDYIEQKHYVKKNEIKRFILVIDNASFHLSRRTKQFVEKQSNWLTIIFLPKRSPNLNPVKIRVNRNLKKDLRANHNYETKENLIKIVRKYLRSIGSWSEL